MRIFRERICKKLVLEDNTVGLTDEIKERMLSRSVALGDIVMCLLSGNCDGNLEKGTQRNEIKFRVVGKDMSGQPLCVVASVKVTDISCPDKWVFILITTFMDNKAEAGEYFPASAVLTNQSSDFIKILHW